MIYSSGAISISKLQPKDALQLNKLLVSNTERFIKYLPTTLSENRTLESTRSYIDRKMASAAENEEFVYVINDQHSRDIIGLIILKHLDWELKQGEFAYCIGNRFKGKGLMGTAIKATSRYVMETMGLETLQIIIHHSNAASINVAVQSGFIWKETLANEFTPLNEAPLDMELYEFSRPDRF